MTPMWSDHILTPLAMESTGFQLVEADERYAKDQISCGSDR